MEMVTLSLTIRQELTSFYLPFMPPKSHLVLKDEFSESLPVGDII
jgi:hypothetical protein